MDTDTPANRNKICGFRQGLAHCGLHPNAPILTEKDTGPDPRSAIARGRRPAAPSHPGWTGTAGPVKIVR